jgi:biopolymer transport protein ExbD
MGAKLSPAGGAFAIRHNSSMNVTPFVDIMLVLLIIFMVSMPMSVTTHKLDLLSTQGSATAAQPIIVMLRKDGAIFVGETAVAPSRLGEAVSAAGADPLGAPIYLQAEKGVRYADFMGLMNNLKAQGYKKLALMNEEL